MPGTLCPTNPKLDAVPDIVIDDNGRFKYILCKVSDEEKAADVKHIVRGTARAEFHSDIYDELDGQLEDRGLLCECLGGGKILHNQAEKQIEVFGKSQGYGKANHATTVDLLRKQFTDYSISYKDD